MKIVIWILSIIVVLAVTAYIYFTRGTFVTTEPTPATTPAPTATPVATPTAQPTPTVKAMTAESLFEDLHEAGGVDRYRRGTTVVVSGVVAKKDDESLGFVIPYMDPISGGRKFDITAELKNKGDLSRVSVGKMVTVEGRVGNIYFGGWITIKEAELK